MYQCLFCLEAGVCASRVPPPSSSNIAFLRKARAKLRSSLPSRLRANSFNPASGIVPSTRPYFKVARSLCSRHSSWPGSRRRVHCPPLPEFKMRAMHFERSMLAGVYFRNTSPALLSTRARLLPRTASSPRTLPSSHEAASSASRKYASPNLSSAATSSEALAATSARSAASSQGFASFPARSCSLNSCCSCSASAFRASFACTRALLLGGWSAITGTLPPATADPRATAEPGATPGPPSITSSDATPAAEDVS